MMHDGRPSYEALERRCREAEGLVARLREVEAREAHIKQVLRAIRNVDQLIVQETDRQRLIEQACANLTETLGYYCAWIALVDADTGAVTRSAASGLDDFGAMHAQLAHGDFPACMRFALEQDTTAVVTLAAHDCGGCLLAPNVAGRAGLVCRLSFGETTYGVLVVSVPDAYVRDDEEQGLFAEVAGDLGFALYNIEVSERRAAAEDALQRSEEKFAKVFHTSPDAVSINRLADGVYLDVNAGFTQLTGYTREDVIGRSSLPGDLGLWVRAADRERLVADLRAHGACIGVEAEFRGKAGEIHTTLVSARVLEIAGEECILSVTRDITERKEAEAALRESERKFRAMADMLDAAPGSILVHDFDGRFYYANARSAEINGYTLDEYMGLRLHDLDMPASTALIEERMRRIAETGEAAFEVTHHRKDGSTVPMDITVRTVMWDGMPAMLSVGTDITERKQAEAALRESEKRWRSYVESAPYGVLITDERGRYVQVNPAACRITGYTEAEILTRGVRDMLPPDGQAEGLAQFGRVLAEGNSRGEMRFLHRDGAVRWWSVAAVRLSEDRILGYVIDITDRKQAEEALRESSALLNLSQQIAHVGTWTLDMATDCLWWSDETYRVFGIPPREFAATYEAFLEACHPDDRTVVHEAYLISVREGKDGYEIEHRIVRRSTGDIRHVHERCIHERDEEGKLLRSVGMVQDVTERKEAEEELGETRAILQAALDNSQAGIAIADAPDGKLRYVNQAGLFMRGKPEEEVVKDIDIQQYVGSWQLLDLDGTPLETDDVPLARAILHGEVCTREFIIRRSATDDVVVWANAAPIRDSTGKITAGIVVFLDITDRKRAEEASRESDERFRTLSALSPVGIYLADTDGQCLYANPAWCAMAGLTMEEALGYGWVSGLHPDDRDAISEHWQHMVESHGEWGLEYRFQTREGKVTHVYGLVAPQCDASGQIVRYVGVNTDITERKRAEEAAKREQVLSAAFIDSIPGAFYLLDEHGRYARWNAYQRDEIVGKPDTLVAMTDAADTIHPDDRALVESRIANVLAHGMDEVVEARVLLRGGPESRWLLMTGRRLMIEDRPYLVGIGIDITDRRLAEEERETLQAQLAQAQKMESVGRLAGGVAHDFNNMLGVILGHAELGKMKADALHPVQANLEEIARAAERSAGLTRQLLAFARKQTVAPRVLDLNDTVTDALKMLRRLIGEDIDLAWRPGRDLWPVKVDSAQVDQMLANLCVNARDAIDGVGKITIETSNATFDDAYCADHPDATPGAYVLLAVSDDGCGMDAATQAHLFEPFFTTKGVGRGTGLGLATVYGAVLQNHGFVNVYSEPGHGTTFRIHLPRHVGKSAVLEAPDPVVAVKRGRETVLLVEDEPGILDLGRQMLGHLGYTVLTASTPGEAIRLAEQHAGNIHLLLTDVVMPEMNGRDLARRLLSLYPDLKRMFMSGYTADVIAHHGVLDEGVHFMQKPFTMQELGDKVRKALEE